jgi:hypothetical protein
MGMSRDSMHHKSHSANGLHSVASVYFQNGTTVNVAKIEGTPNYKTTMKAAPHIHARTAAPSTDSNVIADSDQCNCYIDCIYDLDIIPRMQWFFEPMGEYFPQASSGLQHYLLVMQEYLPSWMGGPQPEFLDASTQSLADMISVLKFATETYLGTEVSNATLAMPFPVNHGRGDSGSLALRLDAVASTLDFKLSTPSESVTEITWEDLHARRWKRSPYTYLSCHPDDEGFVLGIEFNEAALTATVLVPECYDGEMYDWITRVLHNTELGARELFKVNDWRSTLANALRDVTALPMNGVSETDHINMLVLLGDSVRDERLRHVLKDVLGDQYDRLIATVRDDGTPARDPQYRGAASAAHSNWERDHYWSPFHEHGCLVPRPRPWFWPMVHDTVRDVKETYQAVREWFRSAEEKNAEAELATEQERKRLLKELAQHPVAIGPP